MSEVPLKPGIDPARFKLLELLDCGGLQGYLAHKKQPPNWTLQQPNAQGSTVVLGGGAVSYERGTPVAQASAHNPKR